MKLTIKDMEILKLEKGDIVLVKPREGYDVCPDTFHQGLAKLGETTGIKFLAADMLEVSVLRKEDNECLMRDAIEKQLVMLTMVQLKTVLSLTTEMIVDDKKEMERILSVPFKERVL